MNSPKIIFKTNGTNKMPAFNFVACPDTHPRRTGTPHATIRKSGEISFNSAGSLKPLVESHRYALLFYDADKKVVGVSLSNNSSEGAYEIIKKQNESKKQDDGRSPVDVHIRSKLFCKKWKLTSEKSAHFELKQDEESGYLYFQVDPA